jgi:cyclohexanone monooxygenase
MNYWNSEVLIHVFSKKAIHSLPRLAVACTAWLQRVWQIRDKKLREKMTPKYEMGCRRIVIASNYFPAVAKKNVNVHTEAIADVKGNTLVLEDGSVQEVDALILATGFKTQELIPPKFITGKNGVDLAAKWGKNPSCYYGITTPDTPNLFFLLGPYSSLGYVLVDIT